MPHYFFSLKGDDKPDNPVDVELADAGAAQQIAVMALAEALRDADRLFWTRREWSMAVTDEQGSEVCRLSLQGWAA